MNEEEQRRDAGRRLAPLANYVFAKTITDGTAGELLWHLFDGGGITVDLNTHEIIYLPRELMEGVCRDGMRCD